MEKVLAIKHESDEPTHAHTVAVISRDETGRVWLVLECFRPRCGCTSYHSLDELIGIMERLQKEGEKEEAA